MQLELKDEPREYTVGQDNSITIKDLGKMHLNPDEQITLIKDGNKEYDLCSKDWGFYATPSVNDRLKRHGYKTALVKNSKGQVYVMVVDKLKMTSLSPPNNQSHIIIF